MSQLPSEFPSFLRLDNIPCLDPPHFVSLFTRQWALGLFPLLALVNNAAMNVAAHISIQGSAFSVLILIFKNPQICIYMSLEEYVSKVIISLGDR